MITSTEAKALSLATSHKQIILDEIEAEIKKAALLGNRAITRNELSTHDFDVLMKHGFQCYSFGSGWRITW